MIVPGMVGPQAVISGGVVPALQAVTETITTSKSQGISWPADVVAGEAFVLIDAAFNLTSSGSSVPPYVTPDGFTLLARENDFYQPGFVFSFAMSASYRLTDGSEVGSIIGMNANFRHKILLRYTGAGRPIFSVAANTWSADWGNPSIQNVDTSFSNMAMAVVGAITGYEINFANVSPAFGAISSLSEDNNYRTRAGRTIYPRNAFTPGQAVSRNARGLTISGLLTFS